MIYCLYIYIIYIYITIIISLNHNISSIFCCNVILISLSNFRLELLNREIDLVCLVC